MAPTPRRLVLDDAPLTLRRLCALAKGPVTIEPSAATRERMAAARAVVDAAAAGDAPVYGLNTGLGANVGHRLGPEEIARFQERLVAGRMAGVGPPLPEAVGRAALIARALGVSKGGAGLSAPAFDLMRAMLAAGLAPVIGSRGAIGAGDLLLSAEMSAPVIGLGRLWRDGAPEPAREALAAEGLKPVALDAKDGLALVNCSAVTIAVAARGLVRAETALTDAMAAAALSAEGYGANAAIFDARLHAARPASGQDWAAAWFREALAGVGAARSIQDALSFRTMAPVFGAAKTALDRATREAEIELNGAGDNPLVLIDSGEILSTPNFHAGALALALDGLRLALAHAAAASVQRIFKLMRADLSGLPAYLSPVGGASAGLMPSQKLAAALLREIEASAQPLSLGVVAVAEMVEDVAPNAFQCAQALERQLEPFELLTALEAVAAAQAIDLRGAPPLGRAGRGVHQRLRDGGVAALEADRPIGDDVERARAALSAGSLAG